MDVIRAWPSRFPTGGKESGPPRIFHSAEGSAGPGTDTGSQRLSASGECKEFVMRSILLWLIGIPIPIILLLALCTHHF